MTEFNVYEPPQSTDDTPRSMDGGGRDRKPSGLGGWLIVVAIGLVLAPLGIIAVFFQVHLPLFLDGSWASLTTPGSKNYNATWASLILFEIAGNLGLFLANVGLAVLFFRHSRRFPKAFIVYSLFGLCYVIVDTWLVTLVKPDALKEDPSIVSQIGRSLVSTSIWVPYMLVSKRVKNTFVS